MITPHKPFHTAKDLSFRLSSSPLTLLRPPFALLFFSLSLCLLSISNSVFFLCSLSVYLILFCAISLRAKPTPNSRRRPRFAATTHPPISAVYLTTHPAVDIHENLHGKILAVQSRTPAFCLWYRHVSLFLFFFLPKLPCLLTHYRFGTFIL